MRHLISLKEQNKNDILELLDIALRLKAKWKACEATDYLHNKTLVMLFQKTSTRTRLSFETAMERLGGKVVGFADANVTSVKKKETLYDTIKIIGQYVDVIAMRHPLGGAAQRASEATNKPIINGGDGANQHPTQTLLDMFTIKECQKKLEGLHIALVGDLKYGRTVHSLAQAMKLFNTRFYFVAPDSLRMPEYICDELKEQGIKYSFHQTIEEVIKKVDILYMTRIQGERFADQMEYDKVKDMYVLNAAMLKNVQKNLRIMHPLPRVNEIHPNVDSTPHAYYFEQAENGLYVRQALLGLVLGKLT